MSFNLQHNNMILLSYVCYITIRRKKNVYIYLVTQYFNENQNVKLSEERECGVLMSVLYAMWYFDNIYINGEEDIYSTAYFDSICLLYLL